MSLLSSKAESARGEEGKKLGGRGCCQYVRTLYSDGNGNSFPFPAWVTLWDGMAWGKEIWGLGLLPSLKIDALAL